MTDAAQHARWLFGVAAVVNLAAAASLLFLREAIGPALGLADVEGTNRVFFNLAAAFIALFGYAYACVARDPWRYRPFIELGAIGKIVAVVAVTLPWLLGAIGWQLPFLVSGDLVFALLFVSFLRRHPEPAGARAVG